MHIAASACPEEGGHETARRLAVITHLRSLWRVQQPPALNPGNHAVRQLAEVGVDVTQALADLVSQLHVQVLHVGGGLAEGHVLEERNDLLHDSITNRKGIHV